MDHSHPAALEEAIAMGAKLTCLCIWVLGGGSPSAITEISRKTLAPAGMGLRVS